jgi:uncharacterized protein
VAWRDKHGKFSDRASLLKIPGFGPKAFEQAAGFLRVPESANPLDNSAVHPERYEIVERVAAAQARTVADLIGQAQVIDAIPWDKYVTATVGMPTLRDIATELVKPGRDPREDGSRLLFSDEVATIEDLRPGMKLKGTVTNVTNFGAFVDIGVHQDGLVHISELSDQFVKDPASVVSVGTVLDVRVLDVDVARRRISLSCKSEQKAMAAGPAAPRPQGERKAPEPRQNSAQQNGAHSRPHGGQRRDQKPPRNDNGEQPRFSTGSQRPQSVPPGKSSGASLEDLMAKFKRT